MLAAMPRLSIIVPVYDESATLETLIAYYMALRGDGISIVRTAENGLRSLGISIELAVMTRQDRRALDSSVMID